LDSIKAGHNLTNLLNPAPETQRQYVDAATSVITLYTQVPCSTIDISTIAAKRPTTIPYIGLRLADTAAWRIPLPRKEVFTMDMYDALRDTLAERAAHHGSLPTFLSEIYLVYDIQRLALFTGSRLAEYGQSKKQKGSRYATIPNNPSAGPWANMPLAFIPEDFVFLNAQMITLSASICLDTKGALTIFELHLRFRFDKSKENFSIRKYRRQPGISFDPITAAINLFRRAAILQLPAHEPIAQFRNSKGVTTCLHGNHVRDTMRNACIRAYPDPRHYCRVHIKGLVSHSNRVTAALCLLLGGASISDIAFRLRWKEGSVPTYLRECFLGIDVAMRRAIAGAYATQKVDH
jgi:hypothetical protein